MISVDLSLTIDQGLQPIHLNSMYYNIFRHVIEAIDMNWYISLTDFSKECDVPHYNTIILVVPHLICVTPPI